MLSDNFEYIQADISHIDLIFELLSDFAKKNQILPRSMDNIKQHIHDFCLIQHSHKIIGTAAIHQYSENLAEIRSLVIDSRFQGKGLGSQLVLFTESIIKSRNISKVFVLTRSVDFFLKINYEIVNKELFPEKIWKDCQSCPSLQHCDETAMQKYL